MLLPLEWLNDFIQLPDSWKQDDILSFFINHSAEVEGIINPSDGINRVLIGEITRISSHPNADKLVICNVNTREESLQIVTGATNIKTGNRIPVAAS